MSHVEQCRTKKFTDRLELQGVGIGKDTLARPAVWGARDFSREKMMRSVRAQWSISFEKRLVLRFAAISSSFIQS